MAHSSLLGVDRAPGHARGLDSNTLGPSDTSDSGSDVAGLEDLDENDPGMPVDAGLNPDIERPEQSAESIGEGIDSDASGTGERRSAGGDAGLDGADIGPDRIVTDPNASDFADEVSDLRAQSESARVDLSDTAGEADERLTRAARADALMDEAMDASAENGDEDEDDEDENDEDEKEDHPRSGRDTAGRAAGGGVGTAVTPSDPLSEPRGRDEGVNDEGDEVLPRERG
jgi:hypothetical protein